LRNVGIMRDVHREMGKKKRKETVFAVYRRPARAIFALLMSPCLSMKYR
jgi:hypothetical protein